jgi:superfamily II DNA or RNA helicase
MSQMAVRSPPSSVRLCFDRGTLVLSGPGPAARHHQADDGPWRWDRRVSAWRCEAIHYARVRTALAERFGSRFVDEVPRPERVTWGAVSLPPLRGEQRAALDAWRAAGARGQVLMPTGAGKTEIALAAMRETSLATLVVAPIRDLMYQWHRRILRGLGYDAGVIGDALFNLRAVSVTTYDSAYAHMGELGATFGLIIFDEEHHLPGPCRREAALLAAAPMRLGLTATPERSDGRHADLDVLVGPVVYHQPMSHAAGRTLAEYDVVRIPVRLSEEEQQRYEEAGRLVRGFMVEKRRERPGYSWADLCAESGADPAARQAKQRLGRILRRSGLARATLYEVVCEDTRDVERSRTRRRSDAYERTRHRRV